MYVMISIRHVEVGVTTGQIFPSRFLKLLNTMFPFRSIHVCDLIYFHVPFRCVVFTKITKLVFLSNNTNIQFALQRYQQRL